MFEGSSSKRLSYNYLKQISMKLSSAVIDTKCYAILPYSGVTKCRTERSKGLSWGLSFEITNFEREIFCWS